MTDNRIPQPDYLLLGRLLRPHGVRGEIRMSLMTDYPQHLLELETVYLSLSAEAVDVKPYELANVRFHQTYALLTFTGIADRDEADLLREQYVFIDLAHAVPLEADEFYLYQLIGVSVQLEDGQIIGQVVDILETGANDVYILESDFYGEVLIPAHDETILDINLEAGIITVRLPEGLLPDPR